MKEQLNIIIDGLKQSANNDLEIIEILANQNNNILIFYHLEQAFEKLLKVLYLETNLHGYEPPIKIEKYRHKIDVITYDLIVLVCDEYIKQLEPMKTTYPNEYDMFVKQIDSFKTKAEDKKNDMKKDYNNYLKNYSTNVDENYNNFIKYSSSLQANPEGRIVLILSLGLILSSCLYKMNDISRYPVKDFDFKNLDLLNDNLYTIPKILKIFRFWLNSVRQNQNSA
ncbi:MAG: hypothetical protein ACTHKK_08260 [Candidatus Nitrosocosmicus sp.]